MISKQQYVSIVLIFAAIFLLFQGTQMGKEHWNSQQLNTHTVETGLRNEDVWPLSSVGRGSVTRTDGIQGGCLLYVGDGQSDAARGAAQWARYGKREMRYASTPVLPEGEIPALAVIEGAVLADNVDAVKALLRRGVNVVCPDLPALSRIKSDDALRQLLGIRTVYRDRVHLKGLHLFGGFLLGGERIYAPEDAREEKERQDLPLDTPWLIVRAGTETYFQGILPDDLAAKAGASGLKNEDNPAILWRHHFGSGQIFTVNGPYMADRAVCAGILQAVMAQITDTCLYPVADAQLFSMIGFPALSDENSAEMQRLYGREMTDITQSIILPGLVSLPNRYGVVVTAFTASRTGSGDDAVPQEGLAAHLRKTFNELGGEPTLSLRKRGSAPLSAQLKADRDYFTGEGLWDSFSAVYTDAGTLAEAERELSSMKSVRTVVTSREDDAPPLSYLQKNVTVQRFTDDALTHTYMQDLRLLGWETSLGYDSSYFDVSSIWWPERDEDVWQISSERVFSNVVTYRKPFSAFARVTASECDAKLRRFLQMDYYYTRSGDTVTLLVDPFITEASFVLRLHGEQVADVDGGSFTALEDGAYLLRVTRGFVTVRLSPAPPLDELIR